MRLVAPNPQGQLKPVSRESRFGSQFFLLSSHDDDELSKEKFQEPA
jgi:hypothetical protein